MLKLENLKSAAKRLAKKESLKLTKAQDLVAKKHGYENWQKLTHSFSKIGYYGLKDGYYQMQILTIDKIDYDAIHGLIGDRIEKVPVNYPHRKVCFPKFDDIDIYVDERGQLKQLPPTIEPFVGPIVFVGKGATGLSMDQVEKVNKILDERQLSPWNHLVQRGMEVTEILTQKDYDEKRLKEIGVQLYKDGGEDHLNVTFSSLITKGIPRPTLLRLYETWSEFFKD